MTSEATALVRVVSLMAERGWEPTLSAISPTTNRQEWKITWTKGGKDEASNV